MFNLCFILFLFCSFPFSTQAIEFATARDHIVVNLVSSNGNGTGTQFGKDSSGVTRVRAMAHGGSHRYTYFNSAGAEVNTVEIDDDEALRLVLSISKARQCPVTLRVDRARLEIAHVESQCDEAE